KIQVKGFHLAGDFNEREAGKAVRSGPAPRSKEARCLIFLRDEFQFRSLKAPRLATDHKTINRHTRVMSGRGQNFHAVYGQCRKRLANGFEGTEADTSIAGAHHQPARPSLDDQVGYRQGMEAVRSN